MSSESQRVVKIRLEIEIPQEGSAERSGLKILDAKCSITQPFSSASGTPTIKARPDSSVGRWLICTQGFFPTGTPPRYVWAKVYNQGATIDANPPSGTMGQIVAADGTWGVVAPFELPVPQPTGTSTFVLWADYLDHYSQSTIAFNTDTTGNLTECQAVASGSGTGGGIVLLAALGVSIPKTLYAHISNAGSLSGVYALLYDPSTTAWTSDNVCGSHGFRLQCPKTDWQLNVKGATYQPSVAQCGPSGPFQIVFHQVDLRTTGGTANAAVEILLTRG
jgi:hypothetical protein